MIFDRSYLIYNVLVPLKPLGDVIFRFKDTAHYVYGGIPRLCAHVEEYKEGLRLPDELFHKIDIPYHDERVLSKKVAAHVWVKQVMAFDPDRFLFIRDDGHSNETSYLVDYALRNHKLCIQFNNRGEYKTLGEGNVYSSHEWNDLGTFKGRGYK